MKSIAFVGIDGSGKTTLAELISSELIDRGYRSKKLHIKKFNSEVLARIEQQKPGFLQEELKLVASTLDLLHHFFHLIPDKFDYVIWDRYSYCLQAYFTTLNIHIHWQDCLFSFLDPPDMVFTLEIEATEAVKRLLNRNEILKPLENVDFLSKVANEYKNMSSKNNFIKLDALLPIKDLKQQVLGYLFS